jgi:hypothetical protein
MLRENAGIVRSHAVVKTKNVGPGHIPFIRVPDSPGRQDVSRHNGNESPQPKRMQNLAFTM